MPTALEAYLEQQAASQQQSLGNIQGAAQLVTLQGVLQKREQEQAARRELEALGPNPKHEDVVGVVSKYANPHDLLKVYQDEANRKDATRERALQFAQTLDLKQQALEQAKEQFAQRNADAAARQQFEQFYKTESLKHRQAADALQGQLRTMGLEVQKTNNELRVERFNAAERDREEKLIEQQIGKTADRMKDVGPVFSAAKQLNNTLNLYTPENVPGVGYAKNTDIGKAFLSDKGKDVSSSIKLFGNSVLKAMSGTAVTAPEEIRNMAAQMADGRFSAHDFMVAWPKMAEWTNAQVALATAGLTPKAKERFIERTGLKLDPISPRFTFDAQSGSLKDTRGAAPAPAQGGIKFLGFE